MYRMTLNQFEFVRCLTLYICMIYRYIDVQIYMYIPKYYMRLNQFDSHIVSLSIHAIYIHTYIYIYIYIHIHLYIYIYTYTYMYM